MVGTSFRGHFITAHQTDPCVLDARRMRATRKRMGPEGNSINILGVSHILIVGPDSHELVEVLENIEREQKGMMESE